MATYKSALDWAQANRPYQVSLILQLGSAHADSNVSTACVRAVHNDSPDQWEFAYNPEFFDTLTNEQAVGVMTHEIYHILLHHLNEVFENIQTDPKPYENHQKLVIAHECIVNDNVINDGHDLPDNLIIGFERLGFDTSSYSTREVYDLIPDDDELLQQPDPSQMCDIGDLSDDQLKGLIDAIKGTVDQMSDDEASNMGPVKAMKDGEDSSIKKAGTEFDSSSTYAQKMDVSEAWVDFIRKINPDFLEGFGLFGKQRTTWAKPRKKFTYMYPKVLLPNKITVGDNLKKDGGMKPHIVLALDFSGSIPRSTADDMAKLARSIPDSIDVDCCTFSTHFVPFDHTKDKNKTASGGTSFAAVEQFVRSLNLNEYPKAVVVFTDGYADFDDYYSYGSGTKPSQSQLRNNWYWVATEAGYRSVIKSSVPEADPEKIFTLKDLF